MHHGNDPNSPALGVFLREQLGLKPAEIQTLEDHYDEPRSKAWTPHEQYLLDRTRLEYATEEAQRADLAEKVTRYEQAQLAPDDAGPFQYDVAADIEHGLVLVNLGVECLWLGFTREQAIEMAAILLTEASRLKTQ